MIEYFVVNNALLHSFIFHHMWTKRKHLADVSEQESLLRQTECIV